MFNPLVTIIIPVYNTEKYLKKCLSSIMNQTYSNLEVIAIDDGSTDKSLSILESFKTLIPNLMIIKQKNQGQGVARNKGIDLMRGEYVYFLDSDDYIASEMIYNLIEIAVKYQLDLIRFNSYPFVDDDYEEEKPFILATKDSDYLKPFVIYEQEEYVSINRKHPFRCSVCIHFIKASILRNNYLKFEAIKHEDELFTALLLGYCYRIMYVPERYFMRRIRDSSTMTDVSESSLKLRFDGNIRVIEGLEKTRLGFQGSLAYKKFLRRRSKEQFKALLSYNFKEKKILVKLIAKKYNLYHVLIEQKTKKKFKKLLIWKK